MAYFAYLQKKFKNLFHILLHHTEESSWIASIIHKYSMISLNDTGRKYCIYNISVSLAAIDWKCIFLHSYAHFKKFIYIDIQHFWTSVWKSSSFETPFEATSLQNWLLNNCIYWENNVFWNFKGLFKWVGKEI